MSEKVRIKITSKPSGLIAVPEWVWSALIGMELNAIKALKSRHLVTGQGKATDNIDCYEVKKKEVLDGLEDKQLPEAAGWFNKSSIYLFSETLFFEKKCCERIVSE